MLSLVQSLEFSVFDLLFFIHFFLRLVHPFFFLELLLTTTLVNFHYKFGSTVHGLETTAANIVTLKTGFSFLFLALLFSSSCLLFLGQVPFDSDVFGFNLKDVIGLLKDVGRKGGVGVRRLSQVFKELIDLLLSFLDLENSLLLLVLKLLELFIEVLLEFKDDLADHLNLETLTFIGVEFESVIKEIIDV